MTADSTLKFALALSLVASGASTQRASLASKDHETFRKIFASVCEKASRSTLRVRGDGRLRALATVVSTDGFALTKASELQKSRKLELEFVDGTRVAASRGPVDEECDLLLLDFRHALEHGDVRKELVAPVRFDDVDPKIGSFIACVGVRALPISVGVVSLAPYVRRDRVSSRGSFPVAFDDDTSEARVARLAEDSLARKAGLRLGDVIESVGSRAVSSPKSFARALRRRRPGRQVVLEVRRRTQVLEIPIEVQRTRDRNGRRDPQEPLWGDLSRVRLGFPKVLQHDAVIRPRECGGVIVDLDGRVLGLDIARVGRVETHALPSSVVKERLGRMLERAQ